MEENKETRQQMVEALSMGGNCAVQEVQESDVEQDADSSPLRVSSVELPRVIHSPRPCRIPQGLRSPRRSVPISPEFRAIVTPLASPYPPVRFLSPLGRYSPVPMTASPRQPAIDPESWCCSPALILPPGSPVSHAGHCKIYIIQLIRKVETWPRLCL